MDTADRWYKNAIVYCLDVETFQDSNGDGAGDFQGLIGRLDYLWSLGVTCIWLLPFHPSPNRDNGYDVIDYYGVDPRLGNLGDAAEFLHGARERGIKVIIDLVVNHTSDQHPWFQAARDRNSKYHQFYVWSDEEPPHAEEGVVFPGVQESTWTYDEAAQAWYHHRFYKHQPDLNIGNEAVRQEIRRIMGFWLALGVSGFRIDAAPFLIEMPSSAGGGNSQVFDYLDDFYSFLSWHSAGAILLAEANVTHDQVLEYFGQGDRMQMIFNFFLNQHVFLALARGEAEPIVRALKKQPNIPPTAQWANFLRNHDEIDLGRLSEQERQECFDAFGPEPYMQLYERGVRRRLAPMLGGDRRRIEMAFSLAFSLPGTPVVWYGDEIGMGEDLSLPERSSVRTPMQWSDGVNAGFSDAPPHRLPWPVVSEGPFGYKQVNVLAQHRDGSSMMNWMERLIALRKESPELGWGEVEVIATGDPAVLAHRATWEGRSLLAAHNLGDKRRKVRLDLSGTDDGLLDWFGNRNYGGSGPEKEIELDPYGYRWFRSRPDL